MNCTHLCNVCALNQQRLAREWQDSILQHEKKRDEEARLREGLERRAERAEALLARAHALLEGKTHVLEHEIAKHLWPSQ